MKLAFDGNARTEARFWSSSNTFFFQAKDGIRDYKVTGVQTCALPIYPANEVSPDSGTAAPAKPANGPEVSTDSVPRLPVDAPPVPAPGRSPMASACEPYRELIAAAVARGRNAMAIWQDLVDGHGFPAGYASSVTSRTRRSPG